MQSVISGIVLLSVSVLAVSGGADEDVRKELKALEGKWKSVGGESGGQAFPPGFLEFTMVVGADGKTTGKTAKEEFQFTMIVHPKDQPKTIENHHESGAQKGKKQYGIYKLEGDKFTVCVTARGAAEKDRPKDFVTKGSGNVIFVFERVQDAKKP